MSSAAALGRGAGIAGCAGRRVQVLRLSPAVLQPPNAAVAMHRPPSAMHRCELFRLHLYSMRSRTKGTEASLPPHLLGPPWLPFPPTRETHEARHLRRAVAASTAITAHDTVPLLPTAVLISKKRVHKHAVVRNRCRTRLMAALRAVVREVQVSLVPGHAYVFFGTAHLYHVPMERLQQQVEKALVAVSSPTGGRGRRS
ncbi:hypothetical protein MNAN1_002398 [Malassezia nana]|uniref:Uncharacterized protein n=1 Tax=Malassezia nana TaxID=180528 RepID=A0AAF0EJA0_9BASI|nr:hypothetical protein MNAN1_002398 [Malassezia nana]